MDYKSRIIPDHLYPKFGLLLDRFENQKKQNQRNTSKPSEENSKDAPEENIHKTGHDRIEAALKLNAPQGTDAIIRKMMESTKPEAVNIPSNLKDIRKPTSYNKKKGDKTGRNTNTGYIEPV